MAESPEVTAARKEERVLARLDGHETQLLELRQAQLDTTRTVGKMGESVIRLEQAMAEQAAAATAVSKALTERATATFSRSQLFWMAAGVIVAFAGLLIGVKVT